MELEEGQECQGTGGRQAEGGLMEGDVNVRSVNRLTHLGCAINCGGQAGQRSARRSGGATGLIYQNAIYACCTRYTVKYPVQIRKSREALNNFKAEELGDPSAEWSAEDGRKRCGIMWTRFPARTAAAPQKPQKHCEE
ncbi:hypothetical protein C8R45DRAFT_935510 [Mycena sanguinolenta]|nr:hypothetical protein C8R45DRAFT_935510 [Mycena sanguinolenta]